MVDSWPVTTSSAPSSRPGGMVREFVVITIADLGRVPGQLREWKGCYTA